MYRLSFSETQKSSPRIHNVKHEMVEGEKFPKPLQRSRIIYERFRRNSILNYRVDFALISHDFCSINFASEELHHTLY